MSTETARGPEQPHLTDRQAEAIVADLGGLLDLRPGDFTAREVDERLSRKLVEVEPARRRKGLAALDEQLKRARLPPLLRLHLVESALEASRLRFTPSETDLEETPEAPGRELE